MTDSALTAAQRDLARHALGLNRQRQAYRNHFVTGAGCEDHDHWQAMVATGLAVRRPPSVLSGGGDIFMLTRRGAEAALAEGERLFEQRFPDDLPEG